MSDGWTIATDLWGGIRPILSGYGGSETRAAREETYADYHLRPPCNTASFRMWYCRQSVQVKRNGRKTWVLGIFAALSCHSALLKIDLSASQNQTLIQSAAFWSDVRKNCVPKRKFAAIPLMTATRCSLTIAAKNREGSKGSNTAICCRNHILTYNI